MKSSVPQSLGSWITLYFFFFGRDVVLFKLQGAPFCFKHKPRVFISSLMRVFEMPLGDFHGTPGRRLEI
jgi:hypothetical protein